MTDAQPKLYSLIGTNGTGKSTFCKKLINKTIAAGGRALVITPHDMEWLDLEWLDPRDKVATNKFTGVRKTIFSKDWTLQAINNNLYNALIVFDDCRIYFKKMTAEPLEKLFISRRQKRLNQVIVAHGFTAVPPTFFTYTSYYVLFRTTDNIKKRANDLNNFEYLQKMQVHVNQVALKENPYYYKLIRNQ